MDKLYIASCMESQVDSFIQTLNDKTLLLATDTLHLYTRLNGRKALLNGTVGARLVGFVDQVEKSIMVVH